MNMPLAFTLPDWRTDPFEPITLEELNTKADMLCRIDNKYVVTSDTLRQLLPIFAQTFDILEIDAKRAFTYDTRYFDSLSLVAYYEHHQGLRKGFKVRVRHYVDAELTFLELKVKGARGMTMKYRLPLPAFRGKVLPPEAEAFVRDTYADHYGKPFVHPLRAALDIRYNRITLVARDGRERMTIDTDLSFRGDISRVDTGDNRFIIETKSENGRGRADRLLRNLHARPTKKCSKYCLGQAALGQVKRFNRFLPTLRRLGIADVAYGARERSEVEAIAAIAS